MSMVECPCCHRRAEAREMKRCPECGAYACPECMSEGACPECAAERRR